MSRGFGALRAAAERTRTGFATRMAALVHRSELDANTWDDLEEALILADVGFATTDSVLSRLKDEHRQGRIRDADDLRSMLTDTLVGIMTATDTPPLLVDELMLVLVVGFNGAGKTTSVAKLGRYWQRNGRRVLLVAGDTFRAAGTEQLEVWASRLGLPSIVGQRGGDAAALAFDAVAAARARGLDLVLMDTAGRVHTKTNLMEELRKLRRVSDRQGVVCRTLLVLDANAGQNGIAQVRAFKEAVGLDGIIATKLDGTAKGGVLFSVAKELGAPVRFVGLGEDADDLEEFDAREFVSAVVGTD